MTNSGWALTATTYAGIISGSGAVVKQGHGSLTLTGQSTYTGGTTIKEGHLIIGVNNALRSTGAVSFTGSVRGVVLNIKNTFSQTIGNLSG